jgi:hypothetical protein
MWYTARPYLHLQVARRDLSYLHLSYSSDSYLYSHGLWHKGASVLTNSLRSTFASLASLGALALTACQGGDSSRPPGDPVGPSEPPFVDTGAPLAPGNEETVGVEHDAARVAFTASAGGFRAGHDTHQVDITNGLIEVTAQKPQAGAAPIKSRTFALQTASVVRGEALLDSTPIGSALSARDTVTTARAGYTETVRNAPEGIEQSWHFATEPDGEGDLMIAVSASGLDYQGRTAGGLHFRTAGQPGLRYGHGTWIEADGDRWEVPAQYDNGHIVLAVPEEVVAGSAYPAVLDPIVTAEVLNDVPVLGSSGSDNADGDIAGDASGGYLVVWQDRRNTRNDDIWGTRVSATGAVLDTHGIKIFQNPTTTETEPVVAWVGNGWVVAWQSNGDIAAAKVATNGNVTQLGIVASTPAAETEPAIASRGNEALLTWMVGGADIYAARYAGAGAGAFGAPFPVAVTAAAEKNPDVAANPAGEYLVVFQEGVANDNIRGQRVSAAGAVTGTPIDVTTENGSQTSPSVSFNGGDFVVVWTTSTGTIDIRGARVSTTGTALDASPGVLVTGAPEQQTFPDVSCTAASCFVSWQDRRNSATTDFDVYGRVLSSSMIAGAEVAVTAVNRPQSTVGIARSGAQWMAVWTDLRDGEVRGMYATRVSDAGVILDPAGIQLGKGNDRHATPTVTRTPSIWSVMWAASRTADYNAVHVRYNASGVQLDANPITISAAAASQLPTSAVFTGTNLLAVWTDSRGATGRDIYGARINPTTGQPLDAAGFAISTAAADQAGAKIASNGVTSLVVWQDRRTGSFDVHGALLAADGTIATPDFVICSAFGDQARPNVAYDTTNGAYLVTWQDPSADVNAATTDIRAATVSAAGALLSPACGSVVSAAPGSQLSPDIAFSGGRFLIAWEDRRSDSNGDIYGARVSIAGGAITVQDPAGLAISAVPNAAQTVPTVAPYGGNFVLAWEDGRNLGTTKVDIYGSRVVAASGVAEAAFAISTNAEDERSPDIADGPTATSPAKIAYLRTRPDLDSVRVQVRRITFQTSTGAACSNNSQCASGFCVDSRCCDTACGGGSLSDCQACSVARGAANDGVCGVIAGPNQVICRNYARVPGICDLREYCDGVNSACPPDVGTNQGVVCNAQSGAVCPSNSVAGAPHICPGG